jgi:hypothetical protein
MADVGSVAVGGHEWRGYRRGTTSDDGVDPYVIPVADQITTYQGNACTFITPGRGTTSQKIAAIHNAAASPVTVSVNRIRVDILSAAPKILTTVPPIIRVNRFTTLPTGGATVFKTPPDSANASHPSVTLWGDASAESTSSATTLTITHGLPLAQVYGPRLIGTSTNVAQATTYEPIDTVTFFENEPDVTLRAGEGVCVFLDQTVAAGNLTSDRWITRIDWHEYTRP